MFLKSAFGTIAGFHLFREQLQPTSNSQGSHRMTRITYEVVEHEGAWAYKVGDVFSETFPSRTEAAEAAERAAAEHEQAGRDETIEYQDESGAWHEERASGDDRPQTDVKNL